MKLPAKKIFLLVLSEIIATANISLLHGAVPLRGDTLAVIGKSVITANQFEQLYKNKLRSVGMTDNGEMRVKYLQNLVDNEVLIAHAKQVGLNKTKMSQTELKRIQQQELLAAFVEQHISGTLTIFNIIELNC